MIIDSIKENSLIAKEYKELLKISYQSLSREDRKLIRLAFNTSVDAHKNQRRKHRRERERDPLYYLTEKNSKFLKKKVKKVKNIYAILCTKRQN